MQCHDNFPRINVPDFKLLSNGPISDLRMLRNQGKVFQGAVLGSFPYVLMEGLNQAGITQTPNLLVHCIISMAVSICTELPQMLSLHPSYS